ncbi:hypothetical protein [Tropicimonas sp. S265A]|uniref:hypothetical protein n=1 Tax=Tropicimonas sp. S265A TaxID=3415134 RepID=UPI003C7D8AD4
MRMIGIGLMGFLLAGVALLLSNLNILEQGKAYVRTLASGPHMVFEHRLPARSDDADRAIILRTNPDQPVILSGLPAYQRVAFTFPVDARPTSGYLQIDATFQVLDGVEGVLRISIHNTRRGEMLLRSGEAGRSLQIPLSPTDFVGNRLVVSFSLQGTGPKARCGPQDGVETVVEIETTSAVHVTLDRPLQSPRDRVHIWGNVVRVAWPHWLQRDEQLRRLVLATQAVHRGLNAEFVPNTPESALSTDALRKVLATTPAPPPAKFDGAVAQAGANAGVRRFHRQAIWRMRYDMEAGTLVLPNRLELDMQFGRLLGHQNWALTVSLNSRLVFQAHIPGAQTEYEAVIALPAHMQAKANTLEVVATTTAPRSGICDEGPELVAEVLPTSRLVAGTTHLSEPLAQVHAVLRDVGPVNVALGGALSSLEARLALDMLRDVVPNAAALKPAGQKAHVTLLAPGQSATAMPAGTPVFVVSHDGVTGELAVVETTADLAPPPTGLTLWVTPTPIALPEAKG